MLVVAALGLAAEGAAHATAPPRTTVDGAWQKWTAQGVEITLDPSLDALGEDASEAIRDAFGAWVESAASLPRITFVVAKTPGEAKRDGVNRVLATRRVLAGHERDVAYTASWADTATGALLETDIVFNLEYAFGTLDASSAPSPSCTKARRYDAASVAAHEVGHFFGLAEDVDDETTTMWIRTEPCDLHKRTLQRGDRVAIDALYGAAIGKPGEPALTVTAGCSTATRGESSDDGSWVIAAIVAAIVRRTLKVRGTPPLTVRGG